MVNYLKEVRLFQEKDVTSHPTYEKMAFMEKKDNEKKRTWGGARPGAGRKSNGNKSFPVRVSGELAKLVEAQENRSEFIRECIIKATKMDEHLQKNAMMAVVEPADGEILDAVELPFFDNAVAAGYPTDLGDIHHGETINISEILCPGNHPQITCLVKGESMIGARIFPGDYIVVDVSPRIPTEHEIALCEVNGEYTIKYVKQVAEGFMLVPANEKFKPVLVRPGDDFHIRGIVKSAVREF